MRAMRYPASVTLTRPDLLLHPVRLRIVLATSGHEQTTAQLSELLSDVPPATLYRHIATLTDAGLLEVVAERQVRGGVERTFRLVAEAAGIGSADAAAMTPEQHQRGFVAFVGTLVEAFGRYLRRSDADPGSDPVGYRQVALWLSDDEAAKLVADLSAVVDQALANEPGEGRRRLLLSTVFIPEGATGVR